MEEIDDATVIERCRLGDLHAFGSLVEKYQKTLYNVALKITGSREDAKDITQNTFLKAYEKLQGYDRTRKFYSWLYRIMMNEAMDMLSTRKRHRIEPLDEQHPSMISNPEEQYMQHEMLQLIDHEVMKLSPDYRAVLILRHFADQSLREISYILNVPEKTVKSRLFSARELLRTKLVQR